MSESVLDLVAGRQGHFRLESGYHSNLWLDLDLLFVQPARLRPLVDRLAVALRPFEPAVVCGPLTGGALVAQMLAETLQVEFAFTERIPPPESSGLYQVRYHLPSALRGRARGKRFAVVDDVISAGSAVRGTCADVESYGGVIAAVGALLVLGPKAQEYFRPRGTAVIGVDQLPYAMWLATECPLCQDGVPLDETLGA